MKMHHPVLALTLCSVLICGASADAKKAGLTTDKKQFSYAVGQQIGRQLKSSGLDIDTKTLADSIQDVLSGKESKLSPDEMRAAMGKANEAAQAKMESAGKENKSKGDKFLADN